MPPLPADFTHTRVCKPFCEKSLTLPQMANIVIVGANQGIGYYLAAKIATSAPPARDLSTTLPEF